MSGRNAVRQYITKVITVLVLILLASGCATARKKPTVPPPSRPEVRKEILKTALSLKGRPYKKKAKGPGAFDCSGFVQYVYKKAKINLPSSTKEQSEVRQKIPLEEVSTRDLVFFRTVPGLSCRHHAEQQASLFTAQTQKGVTIERLDAAYWKKKRAYFKRVL